jgi:hypothetical protein
MKKILRLLSAAMLVAVMVLQPTSVVPFTSSSAPTVAADTTAGSCLIANGAPSNLNCNSNNVAISNPSVNVINGCNGTSGDTTTFDLTARVVVANSHRYDIGFWVSTNGQSPVNGSSCIAANMAGQG